MNERFGKFMQTLESSPSGLISKAFIDAKDQKAAYRFLENEKTNFEAMFQSHQLRVRDRCKNHKIILAIQDSTSILLRGARKVSGIGNIGDLKSSHPGLNIHTSILMTPQQEILGIARNVRLEKIISEEMTLAEVEYKKTQIPQRRFMEFQHQPLDKNWGKERRVIAKAEYLEKGSNPRFIITTRVLDKWPC